MMSVQELASIVAQTVPTLKLISREPRWQGRCPFPDHLDKTPSFQIFFSRERGKPMYHCKGCQKWGDPADWMRIFHGTKVRFDRKLVEQEKLRRKLRARRQFVLHAYHVWRPDCCCPEWLLEIK
jgi:hypothetical protein